MHLVNTQTKLEQGTPCSIIVIGDSLTRGWMVSQGYVDFLRRMIPEKYARANVTVSAQGVPGDSSGDGLYRLERDILRHDPSLVMIQFGLNDLFIGESPDRFETNLHTMVERIKDTLSSEILLLTSSLIFHNGESQRAQAYYDRIIETGEDFNIPVVRVHEYWKKQIESGTDHGSLVQFDRVHPTEEGYYLMARAIMELL